MAALHLVVVTVVSLGLLCVSIAAGAAAAYLCGVRRPAALYLAGFVLLALQGYAVFWLYVASPATGTVGNRVLEVVVTFGAAAGAWRGRRALGHAARHACLPVSLTVLAALFVTGLGFSHGGVADPLGTAATRYRNILMPVDNAVPLLLARAVQAPQRPLPSNLYAGWSSTDRPPLQTGVFLAQSSVLGAVGSTVLTYQLSGTLLQCLWIPALLLLLDAAGVERRASLLAIGACLFTGFALLNMFYVWPKLLPAAYMLMASAVLVEARVPLGQGVAVAVGLLIGLAAGAAMLAHQGSIFGLVGIVLTVWVTRRFPRRAVAASAVAGLLLLQGSWSTYQHFGAVENDRLLKYQLTGLPGTDPQNSLLHDLLTQYGRLTPQAVLHNKASNFATQVTGEIDELSVAAHLIAALPTERAAAAHAAGVLRDNNFYHLLPAMGLIAPGALVAAGFAALRRRRSAELRAAVVAWTCIALGGAVWCLTLFGPRSTILHQGSYLFPLLAVSGSVLLLWHAARIAAYVVVTLNASLTLIAYWWVGPVFGVAADRPPVHSITALAAAAGVGFTAVLLIAAHPPRSMNRSHRVRRLTV